MKDGLSGWPLLNPSWNDSNFDWSQNAAAFLNKGLFYKSLIDVYVFTGYPSFPIKSIVKTARVKVNKQIKALNILHHTINENLLYFNSVWTSVVYRRKELFNR